MYKGFDDDTLKQYYNAAYTRSLFAIADSAAQELKYRGWAWSDQGWYRIDPVPRPKDRRWSYLAAALVFGALIQFVFCG